MAQAGWLSQQPNSLFGRAAATRPKDS